MSAKYKTSEEVPTEVIAARLKELSNAVTKGSVGYSEFTMRIPAEVDRDADIVLAEAARRLMDFKENEQILVSTTAIYVENYKQMNDGWKG